MTTRLQDHEQDRRTRSIARAQRALERITERPPRQAPPRVEVVQRNLKGAIGLLELLGQHLDAIRDLAYDRARAAERIRVQGGDRDYALDTNGDPKARELYQQVAWEVIDLIEDSTFAAHEVVKFMKDGDQASRRRTAADASPEDVVAAIEAQHRRVQRGESQLPTEAQPKPKGPTMADLEVELRSLRSAAAKVRPTRLTKSERARLTPLELQAWERAVPRPDRPAKQRPTRPSGGWRR